VVIKALLFKFNWNLGSIDSLGFLESLYRNYVDYSPLRSELAKHVVLHKWNTVWRFKRYEVWLHLAYVIALVSVGYIWWWVVLAYTILTHIKRCVTVLNYSR